MAIVSVAYQLGKRQLYQTCGFLKWVLTNQLEEYPTAHYFNM